MRTAFRLPLVLTKLIALATSITSYAAAATAEPATRAGDRATQMVPFKGTFEGLHVSRTPVAPPVVFDRFETSGQSTQLGRFELVIEATVDFGARPVTGAGTYTFRAADGDLLVAEHTGSSALFVPGTVLITEHAVIDPDRSTGRFAGREGNLTVQRLADAATGVGGVTTGSFQGAISAR